MADDKLKIHLIREPQKDIKVIFEQLLDENIQVSYGDSIPEAPDYHILVCGRPKRSYLEDAPQMNALIIPWAGVSKDTRQLLSEFPQISLHNLHHNASPTAETALALLFAVAKRVLPLDRALRGHDWRPRYRGDHSLLLQGRTALILGFGEIGQRVGKGLRSLGLKILAIKNDPGGDSQEVDIYGPGDLQDLLPRADILILTVPLTPDTRDLIGEDELALLPEDAIVINVSRGPIINQKALYQALLGGRIFGAGLDVWYSYPESEEERGNTPPAEYPFWELENVVLSPHRGGSTRSTERLRMSHLAQLLNAAARGEGIPNQVDLEEGY